MPDEPAITISRTVLSDFIVEDKHGRRVFGNAEDLFDYLTTRFMEQNRELRKLRSGMNLQAFLDGSIQHAA